MIQNTLIRISVFLSNKRLYPAVSFRTRRYFTLQTKAGPQAKECGTGKTNSPSDAICTLAVCDEHLAGVLKLVNSLKELIIKQNLLVLLIRDEY